MIKLLVTEDFLATVFWSAMLFLLIVAAIGIIMLVSGEATDKKERIYGVMFAIAGFVALAMLIGLIVIEIITHATHQSIQ